MKKLLVLFLITSSITTFSQKLKLSEGDLNPLKGESSIKLDFTYDNMTIGKEGLTEEEYIKKRKGEINAKEEGRGEKWEKAWVEDREERFEPQFTELFEKHSKLQAKDDSKYTLIFHTTRTEPGWNVGVMRAPARIDGEALIVETANPKNIIAKITVTNAPGRDAVGFDYESGLRLQEAYAKSGKEIGKLIAK